MPGTTPAQARLREAVGAQRYRCGLQLPNHDLSSRVDTSLQVSTAHRKVWRLVSQLSSSKPPDLGCEASTDWARPGAASLELE